MLKAVLLTANLLLSSASLEVVYQDTVDEQSLNDALNLIRDGDKKGGIMMLEALATSGNAAAYYHLAEIRRLGIGSEVNIPIATMFYRLSSQLGHDRAALKLANILFFDGDQSEAVVAEAIALWQQEALKGVTEAMYMMGMIYWNGEAGFAQDPIRGYGLVWRAVRDGYAEAEQDQLIMASALSVKAKAVGQEYAERLEEVGFSAEPLALHLLENAKTRAEVEKKVADLQTPATALVDRETNPDSKVKDGKTATLDTNGQPLTNITAPKDEPLQKPDDWDDVWHLEVGFAMSEFEVNRLQKVILTTQKEVIGELHSDIVESPNRPGLHRLVFGPVNSLQKAVTKCVTLKRAGFDCFAKAPQN